MSLAICIWTYDFVCKPENSEFLIFQFFFGLILDRLRADYVANWYVDI